MTSSIKSQKTKLSALFNLEFCRNRNGWKLSSSRKEKKPQKSDEIRQNRDVTSKEEEQSDPLNTANVDTGSDTSQDYKQSWDPSSTKSNYKCVTQVTPKTIISLKLQALQKVLLELKEQTNAEEFLEDCPESVDEVSVSDSHTDVTDGLHYPEDPEEVISPEDWQHGLFGDIPWNETESANRPQEAEDWSVDSEGEFMRGVHAAPHSSETELELPPELTTSDVSSSSLCRLSGSQLQQAVQHHSLLLRKLLLEREHRQNIRIATPPISPSSSIEDFLIWEVARINNHRGRGCNTLRMGNLFYKERLITGSYRHGGVGRGRIRSIDW